MKRTIGAFALGLLWLPAATYSQEQAPPVPAEPVATDPATGDPDAAELAAVKSATHDPVLAPAETDVTLDVRTRFGAGVGISGPLGAAGRMTLFHGVGADVRDDTTRVKAVCAVPIPHCAHGFLIQADAGTGGGKLSFGIGAYANVHDDSFKGSAGVALRLAVAHTWGNPIGTEPGLTYVGPELDLSIIRINVTLGTLFRVSGEGGAGVLFSWGLGFGT
jgi:hypothetical protein